MYDEFKMESDELYHYGVLGMRWGVRRSGARQLSGRAKARAKAKLIKSKAKVKAKQAKEKAKNDAIIEKAKQKADAKIKKAKGVKEEFVKTDSTKKSKTVKDMSNDELAEAITRRRLENEFERLMPQPEVKISKGQAFVKTMLSDVIVPAAKTAGKQYAEKILKEKLGLSEEKKKSALEILKEQTEIAELNKRKAVADDYMTKRSEKKDDKQTKKHGENTSKTSEKVNVEGKGTSTYQPKSGPVEEGIFRETSTGRSYVNSIRLDQIPMAGLLEYKG